MEVPHEAGSLLAFADDVVVMGDSKADVSSITKDFLVSAKRLGLVVNQSKTKYLVMSKTNNPVERLACANRCYYSLIKLFKSRLLSRSSKVRLYLCYLRPVLTYGCETWPLTKRDANRLATFERKVLRKVYGPFFNPVTSSFERRHNEDLYKLYDKPPVVAWIRSKRIEWLGHVWRADGSLIKDALTKPVNGKRLRGRPRLRWLD
ncbi:unnamed protein product, partial [Ectocarpus sp. 12 AP-2014]